MSLIINIPQPTLVLEKSRQMVMQCKVTLMTVCKMRLYALCVEMHCDKATRPYPKAPEKRNRHLADDACRHHFSERTTP